jgi:diacylglycerol kinase (ATP)
MPTRAILIQNPAAGQADWREQVEAALATFREAGWDIDMRETGGPGDATRFAREAVAEGRDVVVVAGGDGTVNEALQGLAGQRGTALAVLPGGTVNVWATELGIKQDEADVARRIAAGHRQTIDLGRVNGRYFLMMASAGFDAETNATVAETPGLKKVKRRAGPLAYALAALHTLRHFRGRRVALDIDGARLRRRALMVIVGNTRLYGGIAEITYQARADDGLLDVCVLAGEGPLDLARRFISVALRRHRQDPGIDYRKARRIVLDPVTPLHLQADGEDIGITPATFQVLPDALDVIVFPDSPPGFLSGSEKEELGSEKGGA